MRASMSIRLFAAAGLLMIPLAADESAPQLSGPVLGYVHDAQAQVLRPLNGIPGAAHVGAPLALGFPALASAISPRGDFAVVAGQDGAVYLVRNLSSSPPFATAINGAVSSPSRIALSPDGSAAALYAPGDRLQILQVLPTSPQPGPVIDATELGKITAMALARSGSLLLATENALYLLPAGSTEFRFLANFAGPRAVAVLASSRDAVLADAAANQLFLIRDFEGAADVSLLLGEKDGVSNPVALESVAGKVFIANAESKSLTIMNLATQSIEARLELDSVPTRLDRLLSGLTFLLNEAGPEPLLVLDALESPAIYFVPALKDGIE